MNGSGEAVEYCLKMARMPEDKMMANVIKAGELDKKKLDQIVEILVQFYKKASGGKDVRHTKLGNFIVMLEEQPTEQRQLLYTRANL